MGVIHMMPYSQQIVRSLIVFIVCCMSVCSSYQLVADPIATLENIIEESRQKFKEEMDSYQGAPQVKIGQGLAKSENYRADENRVHGHDFIEMDPDKDEHIENQNKNRYKVNIMKNVNHEVKNELEFQKFSSE